MLQTCTCQNCAGVTCSSENGASTEYVTPGIDLQNSTPTQVAPSLYKATDTNPFLMD